VPVIVTLEELLWHTLTVPVTLSLLLLLRLPDTVPETVTEELTLREMVPDGEGEEVPDRLVLLLTV